MYELKDFSQAFPTYIGSHRPLECDPEDGIMFTVDSKGICHPKYRDASCYDFIPPGQCASWPKRVYPLAKALKMRMHWPALHAFALQESLSAVMLENCLAWLENERLIDSVRDISFLLNEAGHKWLEDIRPLRYQWMVADKEELARRGSPVKKERVTLTDDDLQQIRKMLYDGHIYKDIGEHFGVQGNRISRIAKREAGVL